MISELSKEKLIDALLSHSLFTPTTLKDAMERLQFVQADPIRCPARAQDLILRHRVRDYKINDLEKHFPDLGLDEDYLYAYGFVTEKLRKLHYPRKEVGLSKFDDEVLKVVSNLPFVHPRDLVESFGKQREVNGWGGYSNATKRSLERLHHHGLVRVVGREKGIRIYKYTDLEKNPEPLLERKKKLIMTLINILAPITGQTLRQAPFIIRHFLGETRGAIEDLVKDGMILKHKIEGIEYFIPSTMDFEENSIEGVKFLAPFDPVVWDRVRFEHLWGWPYRFEAYTPKEKRVRGYYAMPILWDKKMIGWVNAKMSEGKLDVDVGYINKKPTGDKFDDGLEQEIESLKSFLGV